MQRLFNLSKWVRVNEGNVLHFTNNRPRKVVVELNSPSRAVLSCVQGDRTDFLCQVDGRDSVEFYVNGPFGLTVSGSDVYIFTSDGDGTTIKPIDIESFTVLRDRRPRNPELEYMVAVMSENMNRRIGQQMREMERAFQGRMAALAPQPSAPELPAGSDGAVDASDVEESGGSGPPSQSGGRRPGRRADTGDPQ